MTDVVEELRDYRWERNGDEFSFAWRSAGIAIGIDQIHESRNELYGEILVRSNLPGQPPHVHWGRLNLSSTTARERLAGTLKTRIDNLPWARMLESVCTRTAMEYRRGEPIIDLATLGIPEAPKFLVSRLLPAKSLSIFFGDGGVCKSLMALVLAICVRTHHPIPNGLRVTEPGEVLYLDWETCQEDQLERVHALTLGLGLPDVPHIHYRKQWRSITDDAPHLRAEIQRLAIKLVIVDSLGPAVGGSLRDEEQAIPAMNAINSLGTTACVLAHITKADSRNENSRATPLGSVYFSNLARSTWEVRKAEGVNEDIQTIGLYHRKANRGPLQREPIGFRFQFYGSQERTDMIEIHGSDVAEDDDLAAHAPLAYRLRALLKTGAKRIEVLAQATNAKEDTVRRTLSRMNDAGRVVGTGNQGSLSMWGLKINEN